MAPEDAKLFSDGALRWVARLLCCVEHGAEWPTSCREVKLVPAAKPGEDHTRPEGYRLLAVLAWLYRAWGKARLHAMAGWIAGWAPDGFYTCVKSRGAADAWLRRAAELEKAKVCGGTFTGGSVDVEKCYDMLVRPLAYYLAAAAGMDKAVLTAYIRFQEAACYAISYAPGYGSFRGHLRGLPQGCPFSQIMLGLHALAWYRLTLQAEAVPRALADDLSFAADHLNHLAAVTTTMEATGEFVRDMGGTMKHAKCLFFSTEARARKDLKAMKWGPGEERIPAAASFRDLGAHIDTTAKAAALTLSTRCLAAARLLDTARRMPLDYAARAEFLRLKVLPKALYGAEVATPSMEALAKLTAACASFALPRAAWCRSAALTLCCAAGRGSLLWPEARILELRVIAFRRAMAKDPKAAEAMMATLEALVGEEAHGTWCAQAEDGAIAPAPPPGHAARPAWTLWPRPQGPVRLLLHSLHLAGAALDAQANLVHHGGPPIDILRGQSSG